MVFFTGDGTAELLISLPVACINAAIAYHLEMFFRDVPDEPLNKSHGRDGLFHILPIFMAVIVESNKFAIIVNNP